MLAVSVSLEFDRRFGCVDSLWGLTANVCTYVRTYLRTYVSLTEARKLNFRYVLSQFSRTLANMSSPESEAQQQQLTKAQKRRLRKRKVASNNKNKK